MILPRSRLVDLWDRMQSPYWFLPSVMFLIAVVAAVGMVRLDLYLSLSLPEARQWFSRFQAEAARSILSTIAAGMLTITGVVFSLTIVSLQLASSQFGPRLLRTFMTSRANQLVLGTFTATFIYCLLVDGAVRGNLEFVPQLSTAGGISLGVIDIAVLIFFIHHVATSIRVETVIANITDDLREVVDKLFPSEIGEPPPDPGGAERQWRAPSGAYRPICSQRSGYIRHIDDEMLMSAAREHDLVMRIERTPGDFVVEGVQLASAWPANRVSNETADQIRLSVVLGADRTPRQDVGLAIRQLGSRPARSLSRHKRSLHGSRMRQPVRRGLVQGRAPTSPLALPRGRRWRDPGRRRAGGPRDNEQGGLRSDRPRRRQQRRRDGPPAGSAPNVCVLREAGRRPSLPDRLRART